NGLFERTIGFVTGHGVIELSAIVVAGAAGFTVFDGWLHPEEGTRLQGLQRGARDGLWMLLAAFVGLWIAGPIEGFVSPVEEIPVLLRVTLGLAVGFAYWTWLLVVGRETPTESA
ncbi:MAG: stage II sporulation protein M, partial [Planctomycetota bacterium]|nr:stage II sporulation protein M [Planctomycetota bacterium]